MVASPRVEVRAADAHVCAVLWNIRGRLFCVLSRQAKQEDWVSTLEEMLEDMPAFSRGQLSAVLWRPGGSLINLEGPCMTVHIAASERQWIPPRTLPPISLMAIHGCRQSSSGCQRS